MTICTASGKETETQRVKCLAWPSLSPDGELLAFEWLNDIWTAPSKGGLATRIVENPGREAYPQFTPDGSRLVFCSERSGSAQVYLAALDGSDLRKHSDHSEGYVLEGVSPNGKFAITKGERGQSGYKPTRPILVDLQEKRRELLLFDATAHSISVDPGGLRYLFCEGGEQLYRSGYRGSRASQIHLFDSKENIHKPLIMERWEARSPIWKADGKGFYYVSNLDGTFNVWSRDLESGSDKQETFFKGESVVLPALSRDGTVMVFRAGQKVYRFEPETGVAPTEVEFFVEDEKFSKEQIRREKVTGTSYVAFAENGKEIVFSAAGELWTMASEDSEPFRLTSSDNLDEREPQLSDDGNSVFFIRDDGLKTEICRAAVSEGNLGKVLVLPTGPRSKRSLRLSPGGKWLSWIEATGDLVTCLASGEKRAEVVTHGWDTPTYDWSPDGKWLVVGKKDLHANRDIWLVPADGSEKAVNVTRHPAFEGSPKWSPDGESIAFLARRDEDGLSRFWTMDVADIDKGIDFQEISTSAKVVETDVSEPIRVAWAADSQSLLFQSRNTREKAVYSLSVESGEVEEWSDFRGIPVSAGGPGSFWRVDRQPAVYNDGKLEIFDFSFSVEQNRSERLRLGFRRIWRTLSERFYDKTMSGTDWDAALAKYEEAASEALESRQFDRVVAQLLGELNASHLTFKSKQWGLKKSSVAVKEPTAHPGMVFGSELNGPLIVEHVVEGSPISLVKGAPEAGDTVMRIAGIEVNAATNLGRFFNGAKGAALPIVLLGKDGKRRTLRLVPISYEKARLLDRKAKSRAAARMAAEKGFAYLPFRKMKTDDLRNLAVEIYRASLDAEGLILDMRDNAGGRVADELLGLFCQPQHTFTIPRDGPRGYPTDRRVSPSWDKPMVVLCNGNTFSNAEIFCHAFKQLGRGKLVGMPTNGGVISAVGIAIPEVGELQIPFRGWFHAETGQDLELNGAIPDVIVRNLPEDQARGIDAQMAAAVRVLSEESGDGLPKIRARYKWTTD